MKEKYNVIIESQTGLTKEFKDKLIAIIDIPPNENKVIKKGDITYSFKEYKGSNKYRQNVNAIIKELEKWKKLGIIDY